MKDAIGRRWLFWAGSAAVLLAVFFQGGCTWGIPDYTLTVIVEDGVTGLPESGTYIHRELSIIEYTYSPVDPLHTVEVLINSSLRSSASGSFIIYGDGYELRARIVDLRGNWKFKLDYSDTSITDPGEFTVTLSGADPTGGTFADNRGFSGTWTAASGTFTMTYADWFDYVLSGTVLTMQGTFTGEELTGSWTATRAD